MTLRPAALLTIATALLLTACAGMLGPRDVELPIAKLQASLERKFPFNNRYLELFDIHVSNPKLTLQPDTNRVTTTMDATIAPPFVQQAWKGSFTLSGMLQLDPARRAVILAEPRMDHFTMDGVNAEQGRQIARISGLLAEQIVKDMPLYTFDDDSFRYGGTRFIPTKIVTRPTGLVVTFEPAR
jgi:hypothetical protein